MSKVATKPAVFGARDSYAFFAEEVIKANPTFTYKRSHKLTKGSIYTADGTLYIDYKQYKNILSLYYIKAGVKLIHGYAFDLGAGLGDLFIMRQGRNPSVKPRVNKGESCSMCNYNILQFLLKRNIKLSSNSFSKYFSN